MSFFTFYKKSLDYNDRAISLSTVVTHLKPFNIRCSGRAQTAGVHVNVWSPLMILKFWNKRLSGGENLFYHWMWFNCNVCTKLIDTIGISRCYHLSLFATCTCAQLLFFTFGNPLVFKWGIVKVIDFRVVLTSLCKSCN